MDQSGPNRHLHRVGGLNGLSTDPRLVTSSLLNLVCVLHSARPSSVPAVQGSHLHALLSGTALTGVVFIFSNHLLLTHRNLLICVYVHLLSCNHAEVTS